MAMTGMTTERVERAIRGKAPINLFGCVFCDALDQAELEEFERAKVRGYVVCHGNRDYPWTAWWCWCQAIGHPYAAVKPHGRRYAWVEFELTSLWHELSPEGVNLNVADEVGGKSSVGWRCCSHQHDDGHRSV